MHNIVYTVQYEASSELVVFWTQPQLVQLNTYKVAMNWTSCTCCPEPSRKCWDWSCSDEAIQSYSSIKHPDRRRERERESGRTAEWQMSAVFSRALCYLKLECFAEAKQDCDSALQNEPNNKKAFYRRALAHKGLKVCIMSSNMPIIVIR